ncbi:MAG TPA: hypothetical protein VFA04_08825 [Bryobacteraceae bacterium]|nr:hypothetical protein [Bryobacteraceae bacterium]
MTYKVLTPFVALESDRPSFFFPAGATITLTGEIVDCEITHNDLVKVIYEGREVRAFRRDVERRTTPVPG